MKKMERIDRSEVLSFRVSPYERELIEKHSKKQDMTPPEYIRVAVLFEMFLDGNLEAMKYIASLTARGLSLTVREKLLSLSGRPLLTAKD